MFLWLSIVAIALGAYLWFVITEYKQVQKRNPHVPHSVKKASDFKFKFDKTFLWGAATAAYQVEGGLPNTNWSDFELWSKADGTPTCKDRNGVACKHWEMFDTDVDLIANLGLNTYRFSVEWSRIEPQEGQFDEAVLQRYRQWCIMLRVRGIEPMVTLHHYTEPLWFYRQRGFETEAGVGKFVRFSERVASSLKDVCTYWITINEPNMYVMGGYQDGVFPPGNQNDFKGAMHAMHGMLRAHARTYHVLKRIIPDSRVGIAQAISPMQARRWWWLPDVIVARLFNHAILWSFLDAMVTGHVRFGIRLPFAPKVTAFHDYAVNTMDFVGMNHYYRLPVRFSLSKPLCASFEHEPDCLHSDMGWDIVPGSLYGVLSLASARYPKMPLIITEHGVSDGAVDDHRRRAMVAGGIWAVQQAAADGANVQGYVHWSLMDNFEWACGYGQRFGIYSVDRQTLRRTLTTGGQLYREIVHTAVGKPLLLGPATATSAPSSSMGVSALAKAAGEQKQQGEQQQEQQQMKLRQRPAPLSCDAVVARAERRRSVSTLSPTTTVQA